MVSLLLPVIYLAFISLGLPDALLGAAWPSMYPQLGAGVSWAGGVSMIISVGTIVSSLASDWLNNKLGTGRVTALSVATTAVALFGFSTCTQFWQLCLWAIPYGLGAGSVDAALNNYVALHYESRHMSWLHCMWGIGAAGGPVIMGWALAGSTWQNGYRTVSVLQFVLTALLLFSLPLWQTPADAGAGEEFTPEHRTISELLKVSGVPEVMLCFAFYSGVEGIAGMWAASYCTLTRGLDAMTAAGWASLFYVGITVGRFFSGFLTMKFNDQQMIRMGQLLNAVGIVLILLPFGTLLERIAIAILPDRQVPVKDADRWFEDLMASKHHLGVSTIAINQIHDEITLMMDVAARNVSESFMAVANGTGKEGIQGIEEREEEIDLSNVRISKKISKILVLDQTPKDVDTLNRMYSILGNIERIGDHAMNLAEYAVLIKEKDIHLSQEALDEVHQMKEVCMKALNELIDTRQLDRRQVLGEAVVFEQQIDDTNFQYRENQMERLRKGTCNVESSIIYSEMLTDYERIGDHILNIAKSYVML